MDLNDSVAASAVMPLATREGLSLFDAAYLDAALELSAPLASRDGGLLAAAVRNGLDVFDLSGEAP